MLLGNGAAFLRLPLSTKGGSTFPAGEKANFTQSALMMNFVVGEAANSSSKSSRPNGKRHPYVWSMAVKPGGIASHNETRGEASVTINMAAGKNAVATLTGSAAMTAIGQLIVSAAATLTGSATLAANLKAALLASATLSGTSNTSGLATALGWSSSTLNGVGSVSSTIRATGSMAADIAPPTDLIAAQFSAQLLDQELVEIGMTVRQALQLVAAATAGKVSGAASNTVVIRNAVADSKDRITATVDAAGNRTSITYDVS